MHFRILMMVFELRLCTSKNSRSEASFFIHFPIYFHRLSAEKSLAIPFLSAPKNLDGLIGGKGFDPFGFSDFLPVKFLQEAELKHSRIAMLAVVGFIATEAFKLPG